MLKTSSETTFYDFFHPSKQKLWKNPRFLTSPRCNSAPPKGPKPCKKRCFWTQGAKSTVNYRVISWQGAKSSKNVENGPRSPTYPEPMPNIAPKLAQHRAHIGKPRPNRGQHRPNIGATSAKIGQHRPNIGQHRRNMGPTKTPDGPKMGPRWAQHSPTWAEHGPKMAQHGTTWHNISRQLQDLFRQLQRRHCYNSKHDTSTRVKYRLFDWQHWRTLSKTLSRAEKNCGVGGHPTRSGVNIFNARKPNSQRANVSTHLGWQLSSGIGSPTNNGKKNSQKRKSSIEFELVSVIFILSAHIGFQRVSQEVGWFLSQGKDLNGNYLPPNKTGRDFAHGCRNIFESSCA